MISLLRWLGISFLPAVAGIAFPAPDYYRALRRPSWAPPPWLFGPAWTLLYALMGVAAWLVAGRGDDSRGALRLFGLQLAFNAAWTPIFFGLRRPGVAMAEIALMWVAVAATTLAFFGRRTLAGVLFLPYLGWVTFAAALNWEIWRRNRQAPVRR
jgi:tryptophan-rich sensory protein